jgi:hypothetical protein
MKISLNNLIMTLKEFKEKVAESPNYEWFQSREVNLNFPQINYNSTVKGIIAIYDFIMKEIEWFSNYQTLPQELQAIKNVFINVKDRLISLVVNNNIADPNWNNAVNQLITNSPVKFLSNSPETEFLIKINQEAPKHYEGVYQYLSGTTSHANQKNFLVGYFLAYEFTSKDNPVLAKRIDSEKKSMSRMRSDFQNKYLESENQLTDYLKQANQKYIDYSDKVDEFKKEKETVYTGWFQTASEEFKNFYSDSDKKIKDLEDLYKEKLKLEAPAKYWSDRAIKLRSEGNRWLISLIITVLVGIGLLIWCLAEISAGTLDKIFQNSGTAIKWSVVFITLISFIAFAIRIFSKLTFSSFHLVRDAEEREQLTYVYLALKKEKNIDETERHLIMQSLFSRADSGLLKDDSGPTMPGNIAEKIIQR